MGAPNSISLTSRILGPAVTRNVSAENFASRFLRHEFSICELRSIYEHVKNQHVTLYDPQHARGIEVPCCELIAPDGVFNSEKPLAIVAQVHGNEPAGLAAYVMLQALKKSGLLTRQVLFVLGSPLAAEQYFQAWEKQPDAHQASRDIYRAGTNGAGERLRDPNRIPLDYAQRTDDPHSIRDHQLDVIAANVSGMLDIHTARGKLATIMAIGDERHIQGSPIDSVLEEIDNAIGGPGNTLSMAQLFSKQPGVHVTGIEAGTHEDPASFKMAANFALTWLFNLGASKAVPIRPSKSQLTRFAAKPGITYRQLLVPGAIVNSDDKIYQVKAHGEDSPVDDSAQYIAKTEHGKLEICTGSTLKGRAPLYEIHQHEELEPIEKNQVVAVAVPGGAEFRAPYDFGGVFVSKSAQHYSDPSVFPWPITADKLDSRFAYPCVVSKIQELPLAESPMGNSMIRYT